MKALMTLDPLTYGVDALRHVVLSGAETADGSSLMELARSAGLINWDLGLDMAIMGLVAVVLAGVAAARFSQAD
jgi:ABC-2 type transport system permease protein